MRRQTHVTTLEGGGL